MDNRTEYTITCTELSMCKKRYWVKAYAPEDALELVKNNLAADSTTEGYIIPPKLFNYTIEETKYIGDKKDGRGEEKAI